MLALALERIDPAAAEQHAQVLNRALDRNDYRTASSAASNLVIHRAEAGSLDEALQLAIQMADYARQAGLGPWIQLLAEVRRLQVLTYMGQPGGVLAEVQQLREHMETLPATSEESDIDPAWSVREQLLATGREAALRLRHWDEALELNAAVAASMRGRGALPGELARARFSDHGAMIQLGRVNEAFELLTDCRRVFEQAHDIAMLGLLFGALASVEDERGRGDVAVDLAREGLRYNYLAGVVENIWISHHNLGMYLRDLASQPGEALVHHLAAALLGALTGAAGAEESVAAAADDLKAGGDVTEPVGVADLCGRVAAVPGADLGRLLAGLESDPQAVQRTFDGLVGRARGLR
jgi:hypothetical protein